ncbi:PLP-dependent aminotransferase family protein [Sphingomonas panacisoli]|uniref:PLP-dependent aminotransferase family protein n=1 Tax=Sphingomonas panacisoli TaxID=1813879 RepID=A0A5B8LJN0_9SPHN|nr:PLP-dependent aminotransferase family protein [Sphingomonas panacisoli]QDZ08487.1 PLP-dependent aminotransferase family protein [Sphingomonas panacisoli]
MESRRIGVGALALQLAGWRQSAARGALYRRLADALRLLILDGRLPLGLRLPGERSLAAALGISRTTAAACYATLRDQGYLDGRQGAGNWTRVPGETDPGPAGPIETDLDDGVINLSGAAMAANELVHAAYAAALGRMAYYLPGNGYQPIGLGELRAAVAERYARRGLPTTADQVLITNGAHHGFALVLRALTRPGDRVVIDHPSYPHAIDAIRRAACVPVPIPLEREGWNAEAWRATLSQTAPRLAYVIADFHNPTGLCMEAPARAAIAAAAAASAVPLIVDETMADLWFDAPPPAPLAAFGTRGTIALGSTGKSFWGGLRVGWIRAEPAVISAIARIRASIDLGTPVLEQLAAVDLLARGDAALEPRRRTLAARCALLRSLVARDFPEWRLRPPRGGVSLWIELPRAESIALSVAAERFGVRITPGPRFGVGGAFGRFLRLPFTRSEDDLTEGIARLARSYATLRADPPSRREAEWLLADELV